MSNEEVSMVQECTYLYIVTENPDGSVNISIDVPAR